MRAKAFVTLPLVLLSGIAWIEKDCIIPACCPLERIIRRGVILRCYAVTLSLSSFLRGLDNVDDTGEVLPDSLLSFTCQSLLSIFNSGFAIRCPSIVFRTPSLLN